MDSNSILQQLNNITAQYQAGLGDAQRAPEFFRKGVSEAFGNNEALLREGAGLQEKIYTMPGDLMNQYNMQYGDVFGGASSGARLNSILGKIGNQWGLANVASGLAQQQGGRIEDIARSLTEQYGLGLQGQKDLYNMKMPLYQTLKSAEENAANRATSMRGSGGGVSSSYGPIQFPTIPGVENGNNTVPSQVAGSTGAYTRVAPATPQQPSMMQRIGDTVGGFLNKIAPRTLGGTSGSRGW
jgi:hypothetical protein